jgi:deoxycytidylate deaminase
MSKGKRLIEYIELMKQWDFEKNVLDPARLAAGTHKYAWWVCEKGHSWSAIVRNRTIHKSGCPVCAGKIVVAGFNDLCTTEPKIASEWHYAKNGDLTPDMIIRHSREVVWWQCKEGHIWDMSVSHRSVGYGCPICSNKRVLAGYNDLLTLNPKLAEEWDHDQNILLPSQVTVSSGKQVFWKCREGHSWKAKISARNLADTGCPFCSGKRVLAGFNDLQTHNPKLANEWDTDQNELSPSQVTTFSMKKVWWRCEKGHSWKATVASRSAGNKCPYCSGRKVLSGYNDLDTVNPELAEEWDYDMNDITPSQVTSKSNRVVWWLCEKGHSWKTTVCERSSGSGCPVCSGHKILAGFNDLKTLNPKLADEWDTDKNTILPSQVAIFSEKPVWWKCKSKGHSWKTSVASRSGGTNCPYCVGRISYTPKCVY